MFQRTPRVTVYFCLFAAVGILTFAACSSSTPPSAQKPTTTNGPRPTVSVPPASGTPSATATPATACNSKLSDVPLPTGAVQVGTTTATGATISCAYYVAQDLKTTDTFYTTRMAAAGWTLLKDQPEGLQGIFQEYFKGLSSATITLSQHGPDPHTTDITIAVETSQ